MHLSIVTFLFLSVYFIHFSQPIRLPIIIEEASSSTTPSPDEQNKSNRTTEEADAVVIDDVNSKAEKSEILHKIFEENYYDPTIRPPGQNGTGPTVVTVGLNLRSVENVDDVRMQYSVQMVIWQEWLDPRLEYKHIQNNIQYLQLIGEKNIWMPDIFFKNEKTGYLHELIVPNRFTRLFPDGRIFMSHRISLVLSCVMNLRAYPLDIQDCPIIIESYGWTTKDLILQWRDETPVRQSNDFSTPRFHLKQFETSTLEKRSPTGRYTCLILQIKFAREFGFYLIQIYLPCSMLVIVSWVSFWLEPSAVEARISLGVTTILTIVTQTYGINQSAPPASYAKALDIWTAWCQAMVFGALLEFASVNYICHKQKLRVKKMMEENQCQNANEGNNLDQVRVMEEDILARAFANAKRIDRASRILFPFVFVLFNVCYWCRYLLYH